jgi:hypothetical protein
MFHLLLSVQKDRRSVFRRRTVNEGSASNLQIKAEMMAQQLTETELRTFTPSLCNQAITALRHDD